MGRSDGADVAPGEPATIRVVQSHEAEPVDILAMAGKPVLARLVPVLAAAIGVALCWCC